ncbi:sigma-70 family RNA polymerase sigma factor [Stieleria sp. ICT_E10.1]|uniref:RNA polymerase sigma factor n=1 Tax=Stieleria sedimenti TaxID=2976331 RepID=UPI00217FF669|nr:sigma-70 family RNA polymerase sigma factor [Stieleria sedimenti]MCS7468608.1 sigma-70 family RNA polymerase sigma factor [Stieleria sedimenti]
MTADSKAIETELAEKARETPREAFEAVLRLYQADIRILTRRHFGNSAEADEVAQEVFVQVYHSMAKFRQEGSLRGWVMAIARNQILLHLRNETRRRRRNGVIIPPEILEIEATTIDVDPFQHQTAEAELHALQDCLNRLGDEPRALVEAFYFLGTSAESLAAQKGKNAGTIRMMLLRIRKQLGKCIRTKLRLENGESHE